MVLSRRYASAQVTYHRPLPQEICWLLVEKPERFSTIVISYLDTSEWMAIFEDSLLAQNAVELLKHNAFDLDAQSLRIDCR